MLLILFKLVIYSGVPEFQIFYKLQKVYKKGTIVFQGAAAKTRDV